jgi:uncharacterized protein (TIGR04141 family)
MTQILKKKTWNLTILLLSSDIRGAEQALKPKHGAAHHVLRTGSTLVGDLYSIQTASGTPKWVRFLESLPDPPLRLRNMSTSGVLFVERNRHRFVLTFGHGRHLLRPGSWEEGFGLRVTLNSIDPKRIRSIDHKKFEAVTRHSRIQTNREGSTADFGLDVEQDLVRAVTGQPRNQELGKRMTGMDALVVSGPLELADLPHLLDRVMNRYQADDYKADFGWIDQIGEVRDAPTQARLNEILLERLLRQDLDKLWLALPEIINWAEVSGFCYTARESSPRPELHVQDFLETVPDRDRLTIDFLKRRTVRALDAEQERALYEWRVFQCIYFECELNGLTYVLNGGKWYKIAPSFIETIDSAVRELVSTNPHLPIFDPSVDQDEYAYNTRAASCSSGRLTLMDRQLVRWGTTPLELCDLYSADGDFIHVKRYGGSSAPLSHLFSQGVNSATAWFADSAFRREANKLLPRSVRLADWKTKPVPANHSVVFAIVSRSQKPIDQSLPFFSRLSLRNAARQLAGLGYPIRLVKIAM